MAGEKDGKAEAYQSLDRRPRSRRSASNGRLCEQCVRELTGRKERFCSDRCRMRRHRAKQAAHRGNLISTLEQTVAAVKDDLERLS